MRLARARNQAARSGLYFMAKRSKALPAAMAIEPSITAPVSAVPEEMHNDPEFWRTQAKMAKLDGRVTLANEAELAAKRAERRTGKAAAIEAENPIDERAERQIVQAAAEREARKPRTPQVAPLDGMAALGVAPAAVETPIAAEPPAEEVQSPSPEAPIAAETPPAVEETIPEPAPFPAIEGAVQRPKRISARAKAKALDAANAEPPAIVVASVEESLKAGDTVVGEGLPGGSMTILAVTTGDAPEPSPVLANGLTAEEEGTYQALAARRRPEPKAVTPARGMTGHQKTIVALCERPEGATGKEMADACGWPAIAARTTCQKIADRFGYTLTEKPKTGGRGITFHMSAN